MLLASPSMAWWNNGHMLTARIAQYELENNHKEVWAAVNEMLSVFNTEYEGDHVFVEAATFPDRFKRKDWDHLGKQSDVSVSGPWHYVNTPYFLDVPAHKDVMDHTNVINAINLLEADLDQSDATELTSYQLRCLIHYIGDIHQPLHAATLFSPDFPHGDRGGNSFRLRRKNGISELHALWDSVVTKFDQDWNEPLDASNWNTCSNAATQIRKDYPRSNFDLSSSDPAVWGQESLQVAIDHVYKGAVQHEWPSEDYI